MSGLSKKYYNSQIVDIKSRLGRSDTTKTSVLQEYGEEMERLLRLKTFPLAVKLLEKEDDIPEGTQRTLKDWGYHLALCQASSMARRDGTHIAMLKEDNWCFLPIIGYGFAEPPPYFLEGHSYFLRSTQTLELGRIQAHNFPHLEFGKYLGIALAPLKTTNFKPDLVMIYCDSTQLTLLLKSIQYTGTQEAITCKLSANAVCVHAIVPVIQSGGYQVTPPCPGDRHRAMAQDDELVFTAPKEKLEKLILALRHQHDHGFRLGTGLTLMPDYKLFEPYAKMGEILGMDTNQ